MSGPLTVREAAEQLNMHEMSVYKLLQEGRLPASKVGSRWKIDADELRSWLARHQQVTRRWLLVGSRPSVQRALQALLGPGHAVAATEFAGLREQLDLKPALVLFDSTTDADLALAGLAFAAHHAPVTPRLLLVAPPCADVIHDALQSGVVTLLSLPVTCAQVEQAAVLAGLTA